MFYLFYLILIGEEKILIKLERGDCMSEIKLRTKEFSEAINLSLYKSVLETLSCEEWMFPLVDRTVDLEEVIFEPMSIGSALQRVTSPGELCIQDLRALLLAAAVCDLECPQLLAKALESLTEKLDVFLEVPLFYTVQNKDVRQVLLESLLYAERESFSESVFAMQAFIWSESNQIVLCSKMRFLATELREHVVSVTPHFLLLMEYLGEAGLAYEKDSPEIFVSLGKLCTSVPQLKSKHFSFLEVYHIPTVIGRRLLLFHWGITRFQMKNLTKQGEGLMEAVNDLFQQETEWSDCDKVLIKLSGRYHSNSVGIVNFSNYSYCSELFPKTPYKFLLQHKADTVLQMIGEDSFVSAALVELGQYVAMTGDEEKLSYLTEAWGNVKRLAPILFRRGDYRSGKIQDELYRLEVAAVDELTDCLDLKTKLYCEHTNEDGIRFLLSLCENVKENYSNVLLLTEIFINEEPEYVSLDLRRSLFDYKFKALLCEDYAEALQFFEANFELLSADVVREAKTDIVPLLNKLQRSSFCKQAFRFFSVEEVSKFKVTSLETLKDYPYLQLYLGGHSLSVKKSNFEVSTFPCLNKLLKFDFLWAFSNISASELIHLTTITLRASFEYTEGALFMQLLKQNGLEYAQNIALAITYADVSAKSLVNLISEYFTVISAPWFSSFVEREQCLPNLSQKTVSAILFSHGYLSAISDVIESTDDTVLDKDCFYRMISRIGVCADSLASMGLFQTLEDYQQIPEWLSGASEDKIYLFFYAKDHSLATFLETLEKEKDFYLQLTPQSILFDFQFIGECFNLEELTTLDCFIQESYLDIDYSCRYPFEIAEILLDSKESREFYQELGADALLQLHRLPVSIESASAMIFNLSQNPISYYLKIASNDIEVLSKILNTKFKWSAENVMHREFITGVTVHQCEAVTLQDKVISFFLEDYKGRRVVKYLELTTQDVVSDWRKLLAFNEEGFIQHVNGIPGYMTNLKQKTLIKAYYFNNVSEILTESYPLMGCFPFILPGKYVEDWFKVHSLGLQCGFGLQSAGFLNFLCTSRTIISCTDCKCRFIQFSVIKSGEFVLLTNVEEQTPEWEIVLQTVQVMGLPLFQLEDPTVTCGDIEIYAPLGLFGTAWDFFNVNMECAQFVRIKVRRYEIEC